MHEEMRSLLNAFLDDELHGTRLLELKAHLASCQACREELKDLRLVSDLLQAAPAPEFMPADRFVSNLTLNLSRRAVHDRPVKPASLLWWLIPTALIGLFFFVRTVFMLSDVVTVADITGLLGSTASWLSGGGLQARWFEAAMTLTGGGAGGTQTTLTALNSVSVLGESLLNGFLWQAAILLLYSGWMATWWLRHSPRLIKGTANPSQS
jgi:Putative zinc-finger